MLSLLTQKYNQMTKGAKYDKETIAAIYTLFSRYNENSEES